MIPGVSRLLLLPCLASALLERERACAPRDTCLHNRDCTGFQRERETFLGMPRGSAGRAAALEALRGRICNREHGGVCCLCGAGEDCLAQEDCPAFLRDKLQLRQLPKNTPQYEDALARIKARICDKEEKKVCCRPSPASTPPTTTAPRGCDPALGSCLPEPGQCGHADTMEQRVLGEDALPGEFPFTALLGQKRKRRCLSCPTRVVTNVNVWICGGTLVNLRYVITAAHCHHPTQKKKQLGLVRLGEYQVTDRDEQDCHDGPEGFCLPEVQDFKIEPSDVTVHPDFGKVREGRVTNTINDIALVRLPRPALPSLGVRVACLPIDPVAAAAHLNVPDLRGGLAGFYPTVVGWGYTRAGPFARELSGAVNRVATDVQQKLALPVLNDSECSDKLFGWTPRSNQICAGGELDKDSCSGDSGGPLYLKYIAPGGKVSLEFDSSPDKPVFLLGIVSFGSKWCGIGHPGVYTRVESFIPWIRSVVRD